MRKSIALIVAATGLLPLVAMAVEPIPKQSGFSGFVQLGATSASVESNTLAEAGSTDLSDNTIQSLNDDADKTHAGLPAIGGLLAYTFADSRTQIYLGTRMEDYLTMDGSVGLGVRQEVSGIATLNLSSIGSSPTGFSVYEDPYAVGVKREATDRKNGGARFALEELFGTGFEIEYTSREVEIDNEQSGQSLALTTAEIASLQREGDVKKLEVGYVFKPQAGHIVRPAIYSLDHDLDGDAMAGDGWGAELNWAWKYCDHMTFITNIGVSTLDADEVNPVFDDESRSDTVGASVALLYKNPFGLNGWTGNVTAAWGRDNNDINFYDSEITTLTAGLLYNF